MTDPCFDKSPGLTTVDEAVDLLLKQAPVVRESEELLLTEALHRVLAKEIVSTVEVPPADNSAMDGYAVAAGDISTAGETCVPVSQRIAAGDSGGRLHPGTAARIFTGAPVPEGADAVVMQEQCEIKEKHVCLAKRPKVGENIRRAGEDITIGDTILYSGIELRPQDLGLAASVGCARLSVYRKIKVALFSTGDELTEPGNPLARGKIYNSNRYILNTWLAALECDVLDLGIIKDDMQVTRRALKNAAEQADIIVSSGGVSVGEEDYVKAALEALGELNLWRVAMKPGKPLALGKIGNTPFLGLPGNPVSTFVTFALFARPFIRTMQGIRNACPRALPATAMFDWPEPGKRREYVRARRVQGDDKQLQIEIYPKQGSGVLTSTCWAEGLVEIREGTTVSSGDTVLYIPFSELIS